MHFQFSLYILPLVAAVIVSGGVASYAWSRRAMPGAIALALMALAIAEWSLGYILEIASVGLDAKIFWGKTQYIGITTLPLFWLIFAHNYAHQGNRLSHRRMLALAVVPVITIILVFTNGMHGLIWSETHINKVGNFLALGVSYGSWFWVHFAYSYILLALGTYMVIRSVGHMKGLYRGQTVALIIAVVVPWVGNILYFTGFSPIPNLDPTPFAFTISVAALAWGIFGFRLMDIAPVARDIVVEEMKDGMIVLDIQNRIADVNKSAQGMVGLPPSELIGKMAVEVLGLWPQLTERFKEIMDTQDEISVGEGASKHWYEIRLSPLYDKRKRFMGRVIILRNITERRQADEQLRQLSRAVEASPTSIVITDTTGKIQYANPKFAEVTGYTIEEALGQNPRILKTEYTAPEVHRELWKTLQDGKEWHGEFCNRKKNGEIYWETASISPIMGPDGKYTHYVAIKEDITKLKQAQEALAVSRDQALEASHLKSQLLSRVSHELRTPLGGILGYAELLRDGSFGDLDEVQKDAAFQIVESANYLKFLVNDLLDEAQIEAKTLAIRQTRIFPSVILQRLEATMSVLAHSKGLSLVVNLTPEFPETLYGDEKRLLQILINLTGNAIKFTKTGEIQVKLYCTDINHWAMQVSDSGTGIPKEALSFIFEPFRQVDNAITRGNRGTGLGLSITKQLVELMNGQITVESEIGKGSTFTVILPVIKSLEITL